MAITTQSRGSGKFVPRRVWSCPVHENPVGRADDYYDTHDPWESPGEICLDCETGQWVVAKDENGEVVMRELGALEDMLRRAPFSNPMPGDSVLWAEFQKPWQAEWLDDPLIPITTKIAR